MIRHTYLYHLDEDGDYVVLIKYERYDGAPYVECTRWMIPGTQLED